MRVARTSEQIMATTLGENNARLLGIHEDTFAYVGPMWHVHGVLAMYYLMVPLTEPPPVRYNHFEGCRFCGVEKKQ